MGTTRVGGPTRPSTMPSAPESHSAPVFVDTGSFLADRIDVALVEGAYLDGAFSLQSEFVATRVHRNELDPATFHAFYVSGSYALTGEARPYRENLGTIRRIRPEREFRDGSGGLGALEIAFRVSYIDLNDQEIAGGKLTDLTAGLNWYPRYPARVTFNVVRASRETWKPVWIFQMRLQFAF